MEQTSFTKLKYRIMWRVYATYIKQVLQSPVAVRCYVLALLAGALSYRVSVGDVLANMSRIDAVTAVPGYSWAAFLQTELFVQLVLVSIAGVAFVLMRDMSRVTGIATPLHFLRTAIPRFEKK